MNARDQRVGGHHQLPAGGNIQDGGVVADAFDRPAPGSQGGDELLDQ